MRTLILGSRYCSLNEDGLHHLDYVKMMLPITEVVLEDKAGIPRSVYRWARYNRVPVLFVRDADEVVAERCGAVVLFHGAPEASRAKHVVDLRSHSCFTGRRSVEDERKKVSAAA